MANQFGTANVRIRVNDADGGTNSVLFSVTVNHVNDVPTITAITSQAINAGGSTAAIPFTIGDVETSASSLILSATTNNPTLMPVSRIAFGGSGAGRTVTLMPAANQSGTANVRVWVTDADGGKGSTLFSITVNAHPTITAIGNQSLGVSGSLVIPFTLGDAETPADALSLVVTTDNPTLIPISRVVFGGSGTERTVTLSPAPGLTGSAKVRVRVTDPSGGTSSTLFTVTVSALQMGGPSAG